MCSTLVFLSGLPLTLAAQSLEELEQRIADLEAMVAMLDENLATEVIIAAGSVAPSVLTYAEINSIDPLVEGSVISGGGFAGGPSNYIGLTAGNYLPGDANFAVIGGGDDNINNQFGGTISGGAHHRLDAAGDHGNIRGGSNHVVSKGSFATIGGGAFNEAAGNGVLIVGGKENTATDKYAVVAGGVKNKAKGYAGAIGGGRNNRVTANYGVVAVGQKSTAAGNYALSFGRGAVGQVPGSLSYSGRYNQEPGDAQVTQFHLSKITYDSEPQSLAVLGNSVAPLVPDGSAWAGKAYILARANNGAVASWSLPVVVGFDNGAGWTAATDNKVVLVDQLGLGAEAVSLEVTGASGKFKLMVQGAPATELHWGAYVTVSQVR